MTFPSTIARWSALRNATTTAPLVFGVAAVAILASGCVSFDTARVVDEGATTVGFDVHLPIQTSEDTVAPPYPGVYGTLRMGLLPRMDLGVLAGIDGILSIASAAIDMRYQLIDGPVLVAVGVGVLGTYTIASLVGLGGAKASVRVGTKAIYGGVDALVLFETGSSEPRVRPAVVAGGVIDASSKGKVRQLVIEMTVIADLESGTVLFTPGVAIQRLFLPAG